MAGQAYMTNGYSNYLGVPPLEGGYVYEPNEHVNWYTVETTTIERFHAPPNGYNSFESGYNNFSGAPLKNGFRKEYMPKYSPQGHHEMYELNYGSDNENISPRRYHERENLMNNFLNKLHIGANRPMNTGNPFGPNKYPSKSHYPSTEPHFIKSQNLPAPNRYQPVSANNYRPTSPTKYRPTSPNRYRPTSPTKYQTANPENYRPTSPSKYRPTSPTKYHTANPGNYRLTSPTKYRPTSPTKYRPTSPTKYHPTSPNRYHDTSSPKYQPTYPTKFEQTNPPKYQPTNPTQNHPSKESHMATLQNLTDPIKSQLTNLVQNIPKQSLPFTTTKTMSDPNTFHPSSMGLDNDRVLMPDEFTGPNTQRQNVSPPVPQKPLMTPTNDINEEFSLLAEPINNSPSAHQVKPEKRSGWGVLGATTKRYLRSDTIDSKEAIKKYNGAPVP